MNNSDELLSGVHLEESVRMLERTLEQYQERLLHDTELDDTTKAKLRYAVDGLIARLAAMYTRLEN